MTFDITHGRDFLVIQVMDRANVVGGDSLIGEAQISLEMLLD